MSNMNQSGLTIASGAIVASTPAINMMQQCPKCNEYHSTSIDCQSQRGMGIRRSNTVSEPLVNIVPAQPVPDPMIALDARIAALEKLVSELVAKIEQTEGGK